MKSPVEALLPSEDGELRARTHNRWCRTPRNRIRGECIFFVRVIVRGTRKPAPANENIPATAIARDKYCFMIEPPLLGIELGESCRALQTIPMKNGYPLPIFSISSQITDS